MIPRILSNGKKWKKLNAFDTYYKIHDIAYGYLRIRNKCSKMYLPFLNSPSCKTYVLYNKKTLILSK